MFHNGFVSICLRAASLAVLSAPLFASNLWFAKDMPISQMNDADIAIMSSAIEETLTNAADGVTQRWSNPDTGAGGTMTPLSTSQESGSLCRQLQIENKAGGKSARSVLDYCQQADGSWKMQTGPSPADSGKQ